MTATARKQSPAPTPPQTVEKQPKAPRPVEKQSILAVEAPKLSRRDTKRLVLAMDDQGHTKAEIAATLDISAQAVSSIMIRAGITSGRKGATRSVRVRIPIRFFRVLKLLAEERNASPSAALSQVIKGALPDLPTARKMVRKG